MSFEVDVESETLGCPSTPLRSLTLVAVLHKGNDSYLFGPFEILKRVYAKKQLLDLFQG